MGEAGLAVKTKGQNAAGCADVDAMSFEDSGITAPVGGLNLSRGRGLLEFVRVGIIAERFDFGELFLALKVLIERLEGQGGFPFVLLKYTDAFLQASRKDVGSEGCDIITFPAGGAAWKMHSPIAGPATRPVCRKTGLPGCPRRRTGFSTPPAANWTSATPY